MPGASPSPARGLADKALPAEGRVGPGQAGPATGSRVGKEAGGPHVEMILWSPALSPSAGTDRQITASRGREGNV